jgi:hypothetical protein
MMRDFDTLLKEATHILHTAEDCWQAWWFYMGEDTDSEFAYAFALYPWVVETEVHAHFVATLMALGKLYDDSPDAVSMACLFREARAQESVSDDLLAATRLDRKKAEAIWKKLRRIRNKNVAHRTAVEQFEAVFSQADIKYAEVEELVDLSRKVLNKICAARGTGQWYPDFAVRKDVEKLWECILTARAQDIVERRRFNEEIKAGAYEGVAPNTIGRADG